MYKRQDYVSGPRVINAESRKAMKQILAEIQDGSFAKRFLADQNSGRKEFLAFREAEAKHPVELSLIHISSKASDKAFR